MKKMLITVFMYLLGLYTHATAQYATPINPWTYQPALGEANIKDVVNNKILSMNNLWVVGNNGLIKYMTRDVNGTEYWSNPNSLGITNASDYNFNSICFLKTNGLTNYGWLVGESKSDFSGILLRTTDYGNNWVLVTKLPPLPAGTAFKSVSFAENGKGYIACGNGVILKSEDKGVNWVKIPTPIPIPDGVSIWYQSIYTKPDNSDYVLVAGDCFGIIDSSLDGGATWSGNPTVHSVDYSYYNWPNNTMFNTPLALAPFRMGHQSWLNYVIPYNHGYSFQNGAFSQPVEKPIWLYASNGYEIVGSDGEILNEAQLGYDIDMNSVARQVFDNGYYIKYAGSTKGLYGSIVPLPGLILSSSAGATSISLFWSLMDYATNVKEYRVYRAIQGSIARPKIATVIRGEDGSWVDNVPYKTTYEYWLGVVLNSPAGEEKYFYFGTFTPTGTLPPLPTRPAQPNILALQDVVNDQGEVSFIKIDEASPTPCGATVWFMRNDALWPDTNKIDPVGIPKSITREIYDTVQNKTYTYVIEYTGTDFNPYDIVPSLPTTSSPVTVADNIAPTQLPMQTGYYDVTNRIITLNWQASTDDPNLGGYWLCPELLGDFASVMYSSGDPGSYTPDAYHVEHAAPLQRTTYKYYVPDSYLGQTLGFSITAMDRSGNIAPWSPTFAINTKAFTNSNAQLATAYNNSRHLLYDSNGKLHLTYTSVDSVFYQNSIDDGYAWSGSFASGPAIYAEGTNPASVMGIYGTDTVVTWKAETPNVGWIQKTARHSGKNWNDVQTVLEQPGGWDQMHYASPPSMAVNSAGTHIVLERADSYYGNENVLWNWHLLYGFRPTGGSAFNWTYLDADSGVIIHNPEQTLASPTICIDSKNGIHVAWDYQGEIYWRMYDPYTMAWKAKANITNSPDVVSEEPSLNLYGDVHLVWQEGNDIYHQQGNWGYLYAVDAVLPKAFNWQGSENVSNSPATASLNPVFDGNYIAWSEASASVPSQYNAMFSNYAYFAWANPADYSKNPTQPSVYPQIAYRQNEDGNKMTTIWTEGTGPLYSLIVRDSAGQVTAQASADLGGETPSIYTIERDGYLVYNAAKSTGITVDYDSTELKYYLPTLDPEKKNTLKIGFYQEYSEKSDYIYQIWADQICLGTVKVPAGKSVVFEKNLPKQVSEDGEAVLRIVNLKKGLVTCDQYELFAFGKATGKGSGGAQSEMSEARPAAYRYELLQNAPNPCNQLTMIDYQLAKPGMVSLKIYNTLGQVVKTLVNQSQNPGPHSVRWNGHDDSGRQAAAGIYFYRLASGGFSNIKKMVVLR